MPTTILFARHGETDWNLERRVQGHTDRPLNENGRAQARTLAEELAPVRVDAVYASDLTRARETAEIVAARRDLPVTTLAELREKHFGTWEGLTDEEVLLRHPRAREGPWGDGETSDELSARVLAAVRRIAAEHPAGQVLVVSHGGPLRALLRHCAVEANGHVPNCHVVRLEVEDGVFRPVD